jgi:glycosyltransferase involved in cell wall biosynthesis
VRASAPLGSIVIAAHNEAAVIARCIEGLRPVLESGIVQVIVVCNGCTDETADIACQFDGVEVIELAVASKTAALRAGDRAAVAGPRIYLDADIVMTARAALAVMGALGGSRVLAARPPIRFESTGAQWSVRRWYSIRERLPSIGKVLWGAGTYALSVEGRDRFTEFPDIVSDDLFIDSLFSEPEIAIVDTDPVVVRTPRTRGDLLKILVRTYRSQHDVAHRDHQGTVSPGQRGQLRDILALVKHQPRLIPAAIGYVTLIAAARVQARVKPASASWGRDNSSRVGTAS